MNQVTSIILMRLVRSAAYLIVLLQISACVASQPIDTKSRQCEHAAIEFHHATSSLPDDPDIAYFGHRCRLDYEPDCLRWCDALQHVNARFFTALSAYQDRCPGDMPPTATAAILSQAFDIDDACVVEDIDGIRRILLQRRRQERRKTL